ncbi:MAG: MBL fold metallo-hydrolase [Oscillospiraceae bacterium]|jgi:glyoxylase-like metal-dependent hydrolase (beta-lactamase superfamily II)|nr:MBL fold metallo-hydrolase [Oscillospiraceae bacterium]
MLIKTIPVGMLETNCYIVTDEDTRKCAIIDPGADSSIILDYIESNNLLPVAVFLTHGHFDHHMVLDAVLEATGATAYAHENDVNRSGQAGRHMLNDNGQLSFYAEGSKIDVGNLVFDVLETPGHSTGSVTLMCENALFTGDTLFRRECGRTDLEGGSEDIMMQSLKRLAELDGDFEVYPGHAESSTLSYERSFNRYMKHATGESAQ